MIIARVTPLKTIDIAGGGIRVECEVSPRPGRRWLDAFTMYEDDAFGYFTSIGTNWISASVLERGGRARLSRRPFDPPAMRMRYSKHFVILAQHEASHTGLHGGARMQGPCDLVREPDCVGTANKLGECLTLSLIEVRQDC